MVLRVLAFCLVTYLFWFVVALNMEGDVAIVFIVPFYLGLVLDRIQDFWLTVWPSIILGAATFLLFLIILTKVLQNALLLAIAVNASALASFLIVGETYAYLSVTADSKRLEAICSGRRSFTQSMIHVGLEYKPWHAWAYSLKDGIHLWSYREMAFIPAPATKSPGKRKCMLGNAE